MLERCSPGLMLLTNQVQLYLLCVGDVGRVSEAFHARDSPCSFSPLRYNEEFNGGDCMDTTDATRISYLYVRIVRPQ